MSNQVRKRTWDSSDAQTNVWFFGDSIAGLYSYPDRFDGWIFQLIKYYKDLGFNIKGHDATYNGGSLYHSRHSSYVIPSYVVDPRPSRIAILSLDAAIADGATDVIIADTSNDVTMGNILPNPLGLNSATDEQNDLYTNYQSLCDANGINLHILTQNTTISSQGYTDTFKAITDELVALNEHNYIDNFYTLADPNNNYLGKAGYYKDNIHPNYTGQNAVLEVAKNTLNSFYGILAPVYTLISDTQCPDNDLVTNNNIAVTNNGEFVFNTP